jgi:stage II sporulation protein D
VRLVVFLVALAAPLLARDVRVKLYWRTPPKDAAHAQQIRTMPLEDYVAGVLAGEAATFTSAEALKAMAVAIRSFAVHYVGRHRAEGFDFCDTTHCQDVRLSVKERMELRAAVEVTESEILWHQGKAIAAHYHRHCGGTTAAAAEVWPDLHAPYLRSLADTFCLTKSRAEWNSQLNVDQIGDEPHITRRTASGRVAEISIGSRRMSTERFQQQIGDRFGWNVLRSNAYGIHRSDTAIRFSGFGHGHGVGLCQTGAEERGKAGHSYSSILTFYYPGAVPGIAASGLRWQRGAGERVDAFAADIASARELAASADAALSQAEAITGFIASRRPQVRTYPTLPIYRDATGTSGAIAATTAGFSVRMQPLGLLRSRGALRSTLVHEMLHVLIDSHSQAGLPEWYGEGLALHLTGAALGAGSSDLHRQHAAAEARVRRLAKQYGRVTLLAWVKFGLPQDVSQQTQTPAGTQR